MKKILLILGISIFLIIGTLLAIPFLFKSNILQIIERQSERYIAANLEIGDMSLSMFKSFPDLNITLNNLTITGEDLSINDTLVNVPLLEASVNLKSLISGKNIIVNRILLKQCRLQTMVDTAGNANWDIFISDDEEAEEPEEITTEKETEEEEITLNDITIQQLYIAHNDYKNSTYVSIQDVNLNLSGNFSETNTLLQVLLSLNDISFRQGNNVWINKTNINWQAEIAADLQRNAFELKQNTLAINDLKLQLIGKISKQGNEYNTDLQLQAPETQFASLLSLIPKSLQHHIEGIETSGNFNLNATMKGIYNSQHIPAFAAALTIHDAHLKYPQLPEAINKINIDLNISNPGGIVDSTHINLKKMTFDIAGNSFNMYMNIENPNDPWIDGGAVGTINFANLKKALPLQEVTLQGIVTTDLTFKGKYQYIEKQQYEKFIAKGNMTFQDILLVNKDFPKGIAIPQGSITITPANLTLNKLQTKIYSSDFLLQGNLSNYLPYFFKNETLKGNFSLTSGYINLNEFMASTTTAKDTTTTTSAATGAIEIPKNIDIRFTTNINTILFDRLNIKNVKGEVTLNQAVAHLKNLNMEMLNGTLMLNGQYNTANPQIPHVDFDLKANNFDINEAYHSFSIIKKNLPIAMNCSGKLSAAMKFSANLDKEMSPVMTTANGNGYLESQGILINNNPAMNQLAGMLQNTELSRLSISHMKINFTMQDGNIIVPPFTTSLAGNPVTIGGKQSVAGDLDYTLAMKVNREFFGKDINNLLKSIPGSKNIDNLDIDVDIKGTLTKPVIKPDLSKAIKTVTKEAEKELKNNVMKGLEGLFKKIR